MATLSSSNFSVIQGKKCPLSAQLKGGPFELDSRLEEDCDSLETVCQLETSKILGEG
jgi:hypothetical protein